MSWCTGDQSLWMFAGVVVGIATRPLIRAIRWCVAAVRCLHGGAFRTWVGVGTTPPVPLAGPCRGSTFRGGIKLGWWELYLTSERFEKELRALRVEDGA